MLLGRCPGLWLTLERYGGLIAGAGSSRHSAAFSHRQRQQLDSALLHREHILWTGRRVPLSLAEAARLHAAWISVCFLIAVLAVSVDRRFLLAALLLLPVALLRTLAWLHASTTWYAVTDVRVLAGSFVSATPLSLWHHEWDEHAGGDARIDIALVDATTDRAGAHVVVQPSRRVVLCNTFAATAAVEALDAATAPFRDAVVGEARAHRHRYQAMKRVFSLDAQPLSQRRILHTVLPGVVPAPDGAPVAASAPASAVDTTAAAPADPACSNGDNGSGDGDGDDSDLVVVLSDSDDGHCRVSDAADSPDDTDAHLATAGGGNAHHGAGAGFVLVAPRPQERQERVVFVARPAPVPVSVGATTLRLSLLFLLPALLVAVTPSDPLAVALLWCALVPLLSLTALALSLAHNSADFLYLLTTRRAIQVLAPSWIPRPILLAQHDLLGATSSWDPVYDEASGILVYDRTSRSLRVQSICQNIAPLLLPHIAALLLPPLRGFAALGKTTADFAAQRVKPRFAA